MASGGVLTSFEDRWEIVARRDRSADGQFYYSVETTGVYCRPSCPARLAKPENVRFHQSCEDAERAGFRPCKRCKPGQPSLPEEQTAKIGQACRMIETAETAPALSQLAESVGMTAHHFHRIFKAVTGVTPKGYAVARRSARVRDRLSSQSETITEAIYGAGYNSNGPFYEIAGQILGMTPTAYRKGGEGEPIRFAIGECSLGSILVAQSERGVCAISLGEDPDVLLHDLQRRFPHANLIGSDKHFEETVARVVGFVDAPSQGLELPLDIRGTAFQQRVWKALTQIPWGARVSYAELAQRLGSPSSSRAVANACGSNPLAIAIPCHRVVRSDGSLSGYRWGIERKRLLLEREASS